MKKIEGKQSGKGLKPGLNMADTGSVTDSVKGFVAFGKMKVPANKSMVSANASKK